MKLKNKRGIRIPTRVIFSALLMLIQLGFLFGVLYDVTAQSIWAYLMSMLAGIITVVIIINRRSNPDHKIAWVIFILILPIFGITVFLLWGGGRVPPYIRKRMKICEARYRKYLKDDSEVREHLKYYDLIHSRQADFLIGESGYPVFDKTYTEYLSSGEKFFSVLLEELEKAEKYIFIEFFIIAEGEMWEEIHRILRKKVAAGVEIKVIFDDFGSIKRQHKDFISRLRWEGIGVSVFNPINPLMNIFMNNRDHRKIVVIDGKTAFTGGVNIGDEYINLEKRFGHWMDSAIMLKGNGVKSFVAMFCSMWEFITRKKLRVSDY